jgi:hypothetical protein
MYQTKALMSTREAGISAAPGRFKLLKSTAKYPDLENLQLFGRISGGRSQRV